MNVYAGTSGFAYKEWKGPFYPAKLPAKRMLAFYATQFPAVEINATFSKVPERSVVEAWAADVPADFRFALKAPQRITHFQRLKGSAETLTAFLEVSKVLKKRLGPILFQLPPNFKKDAPRLREFLALMPARMRFAFEFRHPSWFDDETIALLKKRRVALCIAEAEGDLKVPFVATAEWGYLRLRLPDYSPAALTAWAKRVKEQTWKDAYAFFMHDDDCKGPGLAKRFLE